MVSNSYLISLNWETINILIKVHFIFTFIWVTKHPNKCDVSLRIMFYLLNLHRASLKWLKTSFHQFKFFIENLHVCSLCNILSFIHVSSRTYFLMSCSKIMKVLFFWAYYHTNV
jgi:hypothetical protein